MTCSICHLYKDESDFWPRKTKLGRRKDCIECCTQRSRRRYLLNKSSARAKSKIYYQNNKEKIKKACSAWLEKNRDRMKKAKYLYAKRNKEKCNSYKKKYIAKNKGLYCFYTRRRQLLIKRQLISIYYMNEIKLIYINRTPNLEVDHIIPLNNKNVSGLHVPWNLQYLAPKENLRKRNKFDFTYNNESWKNESP